MTSGTDPAGWRPEEALRDGEALLWRGHPDRTFRLIDRDALWIAVLAAGLAGAGILGLVVATGDPRAPGWVVPGCIFLVLFGAAFPPWMARRKHRGRLRTEYALTDRRALVRQDGRLRSFDLGDWVRPETAWDGDGCKALILHERVIRVQGVRNVIREGFEALPAGEADAACRIATRLWQDR